MQIFSSQLLMAVDDLHGVREWTTYGTYSLKFTRRTKAKLTIVGSGQDCSRFNFMSVGYFGGSGGGYFVGQAYLPAGTYSVVINKSVESAPDANGNTTASTHAVVFSNSSVGALITVATEIEKTSNFDYIPGTIEHEEQGNFPAYGSNQGGTSLYNGYGKGADAQAHNNTSGYFKIEW